MFLNGSDTPCFELKGWPEPRVIVEFLDYYDSFGSDWIGNFKDKMNYEKRH